MYEFDFWSEGIELFLGWLICPLGTAKLKDM